MIQKQTNGAPVGVDRSMVCRPGGNVKSYLKAILIHAYCLGLVSANVTEWSIQKGGMRHD